MKTRIVFLLLSVIALTVSCTGSGSFGGKKTRFLYIDGEFVDPNGYALKSDKDGVTVDSRLLELKSGTFMYTEDPEAVVAFTDAESRRKRVDYMGKAANKIADGKKSLLKSYSSINSAVANAIVDDSKWVELVIRNPRYAGDAYAQAESLNLFYNRGTRGTFFGGRLYPGGRPGDIDPNLALALGEAGITLKQFRQSISR